MAQVPPERIEDVLDFYSEEVIPSLAAAHAVTNAFPKEVLNEIRNSFTHLVRAHKVDEQAKDFAKELEASYRHLKRTCLDCMKNCIHVLAKNSETAVEALTTDTQLPNDTYQTMSALRARRMKLSAHEGQYPTHETLSEFKSLFNDYDKFYQSLDDQFAGQTAEMRKDRRSATIKSAEHRSLGKGFFLGLIASAIVTLIIQAGSGSWPFEPTSVESKSEQSTNS
jgi:hypothetical protein